MDRLKCHKCGWAGALRMDMQDTAYGPLCEAVCRECYEKDVSERRAEGKRFGYRPKIVPWHRLVICQDVATDTNF